MQTFTGLEYLKIDIANNFGLDKKTWNERLAWVQAHEADLESMLNQADTPALYFAAVQAYRKVQKGQPTGYPISLDATSSGMQLLAVLTGDRKAAELCNVVPFFGLLDFSEEAEIQRRDGYTVVYEWMLSQLGSDSKIKRDDVKQAIMTALYGSQAVPKEVFGEGEQLQVFYRAMAALTPAAWELNQAFLSIWNPEALVNSWVLPDNFHVHVKVMSQEEETVHFLNKPYQTFRQVNAPKQEGRSLGANATHSIDAMVVREITRRCDYDPIQIQAVRNTLTSTVNVSEEDEDGSEKHHDDMVKTLWGHCQKTGYLSARILDHITAYNVDFVDRHVVLDLINSLPAKPFKVLSVHDCFRVLPNYGNDLRKQYNLQLHLLAKSDLLSSILSQMIGRPFKAGKLDATLADDILDAEYALS